ncbi:unnamed protein product, partial [Oppiella nova]
MPGEVSVRVGVGTNWRHRFINELPQSSVSPNNSPNDSITSDPGKLLKTSAWFTDTWIIIGDFYTWFINVGTTELCENMTQYLFNKKYGLLCKTLVYSLRQIVLKTDGKAN